MLSIIIVQNTCSCLLLLSHNAQSLFPQNIMDHSTLNAYTLCIMKGVGLTIYLGRVIESCLGRHLADLCLNPSHYLGHFLNIENDMFDILMALHVLMASHVQGSGEELYRQIKFDIKLVTVWKAQCQCMYLILSTQIIKID